MYYVFIQFWVQRKLSRNYGVHEPFVPTHIHLVTQQHRYGDPDHRDTSATINKPMLTPISTQNLLVTIELLFGVVHCMVLGKCRIIFTHQYSAEGNSFVTCCSLDTV